MTVPSTSNVALYTGDGSTVAFDVKDQDGTPIIFYDEDHLVVTLDGVETTDYTVTGEGEQNGGTVTFNVAPANGVDIVITRIVPYDQQTDLENFDGNPADVTEKQFDLCVMQVQQVAESVRRSLRFPIGDTQDGELPDKATRASKFLAFDADGAPMVSEGSVDGLSVSSYIQTLLDDADAATARATLVAAARGANADITSISALSDGSAASPSMAFGSDSNTGFYRIGGDDIGVSAGGSLVFRATNLGGTAVNYLGVINAATGTGAALAVYGSDTNIAIRYISKGTGSQDFYTNGGTQQFAILHTASAVNYARFTGGATGNKVTMDVAGSDTNIGLVIGLKGTGDLQCGNVNSNTTASAANVNVDGSGNLRRSTSSLKYKKDITDYDKGLSVIGQLRPVYYKPKAIGDERTLAGFIAEDLHDLGLSEFVEYRDGEPDGIFYPYLTALLVKGMKELKARVEALEGAA